jgi:hypothetical protein
LRAEIILRNIPSLRSPLTLTEGNLRVILPGCREARKQRYRQVGSTRRRVHPDEKWMAVWLAPIKRKARVIESAIRPNLWIVKLAEIVCGQLKRISQDRLLFRRGGDNFDLSGGLL